jgi:hypothetical protein
MTSTPPFAEAHGLPEPTRGIVRFGDGNKGRVPPEDSLIVAAYRSTRAEAGNVPARTISRLVDSPHNRTLLKDFDAVRKGLQTITNPLAAWGGLAAESLDEAEGRAIDVMNSNERAVTLEDYERLAMKTPGTRLARVKARAVTRIFQVSRLVYNADHPAGYACRWYQVGSRRAAPLSESPPRDRDSG